MDKPKILKIREVLNKILSENKNILDEVEVDIKIGDARFTNSTCVLKLEMTDIVNGEVSDKYIEGFKNKHHLYGFDMSDLGRKIKLKDGVYTLKGINPNARKNMMLIERNGETYSTTPNYIKDCLI